MINRIITENSEINSFTEKNDFGNAAVILLEEQKKNWKMLNNGYSSLESVKTKSFQLPGYKIKVQFNPGRIISSSAKVDPKSISERKCFLCPSNLPQEQKAILYKENYLILCNPFPIFPEHLTIPHKDHIPQRIKEYFNELLNLSSSLSTNFTLLYNGPKCGASAPDHFHFQAGSKFFMPVDNEFHQLKNEYGEIIFQNDELIISGIDDGLRRFISIESNSQEKITDIFEIFYELFDSISPGEEEPMINIHSFHENDFGWRLLFFLREKHRSSHFFAKGDENILLSAASVDFGGICITPLEKDFDKITEKELKEIFDEISLSKEKFVFIKAGLKKKIS